MKNLTERQAEILNFIKHHTTVLGYAPSLRDICQQFDMTINGAREHLLALEKKNAISRVAGKARTIIVNSRFIAKRIETIPVRLIRHEKTKDIAEWATSLSDEELAALASTEKAVRVEIRKRMSQKKKLDWLVLDRLRQRLNHAINGAKSEGSTGMRELIGCSVRELRQHLESKWKSGMSWGNYGDWHIDHILPCAAFDLSDDGERKRCFHWSNLQPLWAAENYAKSDSRPKT